MTIIYILKEVKVKGYYRKNGSWVNSHIRTLKVKPKIKKIRVSNKVYENEKQLTLPFPENKIN